jgi:hypothetical protein
MFSPLQSGALSAGVLPVDDISYANTTSVNGTTLGGQASTNVTATSGAVYTSGNPIGATSPPNTTTWDVSTTVNGVKVFGNGTIITSLNGTSVAFFFDPTGPAASASLTVQSSDLSGNSISGLWVELQSGGQTIATGFTPATFSVVTGSQYTVYVANYQNFVFNHWDDGSTSPYRAITPTQDTTLTAYYSTGSLSTPSSPTNLSAIAASSSQINLSWNAPSSNGGSPITGYKIERSVDGGSTWSVLAGNTGSTATTYSDSGLVSGVTYTYRVYAMNSVGTSAPSNVSSATTSSGGSANVVNRIQSGLVAIDPLNNETKTQQQLVDDSRYWHYGGSAVAQNAPYAFHKDSEGLHIGVQAQSTGKWAGFYAVTPNTNAALFHAVIANPVRTIPSGSYENGLYVQTSNGKINYVTCVSLTNNADTVWAVVNTYGNTKQATKFTVLWIDNTPNQPLSRDCTIITNGQNYLKVYLDGVVVYTSSKLSLQMPAPFNAFLEPQTSYAGELLSGIYRDYYVSTDEKIKVINNPSNAAKVSVVDSAGFVIASAPVVSGTALIDVGKYHLPINGSIRVYDSGNAEIASTQNMMKIFGGDLYSVS